MLELQLNSGGMEARVRLSRRQPRQAHTQTGLRESQTITWATKAVLRCTQLECGTTFSVVLVSMYCVTFNY